MGAPANEEDDVTALSIAEPYPPASPPETLVITMTVGNLSALPALPPNTFWKVYFSYQGQVYFVDMDTVAPAGTPATPEFVYGVTTPDGAGGNGDSTLGTISGSFNTSSNTITWTLPASLILPRSVRSPTSPQVRRAPRLAPAPSCRASTASPSCSSGRTPAYWRP